MSTHHRAKRVFAIEDDSSDTPSYSVVDFQPFAFASSSAASRIASQNVLRLNRRHTRSQSRPNTGQFIPTHSPRSSRRYPKQDVVCFFENLHENRVRVHGREHHALKNELALFACPVTATLAKTDGNSRPLTDVVGLRSRVDIVTALDGWDGASVYGEQRCEPSWSIKSQRLRLAKSYKDLETSEQSLEAEIDKLKVHTESCEVEKNKLAIIHQTLEIETARLKESYTALETQDGALRERLRSVRKLRNKLERDHQRFKANFDFALTNSDKIVKRLRPCERENLRAQFLKKKDLEKAKHSIEMVKLSFTVLAEQADITRSSLAVLQEDIGRNPCLGLPTARRDILQHAVKDAMQDTASPSRPTSPGRTAFLTDVVYHKNQLEAKMRAEHDISRRFQAIQRDLKYKQASSCEAAIMVKETLNRLRSSVSRSPKARKSVILTFK